MKRLLFPALSLLLIMIGPSLFGQQKLRGGQLSDVSFDQFVQEIERQSQYRFYYNKAWTDTLRINVDLAGKTLQQALSEVTSATGLYFAVDNANRVFATREREIMTELPEGYFGGQPASRDKPAFDFSAYEKKSKILKEAEAKVHAIGRNTGNAEGTATIAGNIVDTNTGEPLIGASVFVENPVIGITTDQFGYYALTLPKGRHELKIQSIGMKSTARFIMLYANGRLDIEMEEEVTPLKEVVVEAEADAHVKGMQMGMEKLEIKTMKQIPLALGETDIMKVVLTLPGVQSVGEGTVGLNVRGGAANQNLILFNDAIVYNPSHLFGFFSTFNPDILKNVELYKSTVPAEFGGRLSAVLDVHSREGNTRKFSGSGGISPITGRLSLEGPIAKDKTSFIIGARSTYSGWLLRELDSKQLRNSAANFYDVTANVSHKIDDNNNLYLSAYTSRDNFRLNNDTLYNYRDQNASLKWKHLFNNKLYGVITTGFSHYDYSIESRGNPSDAFRLTFDIRQVNAKADFSFFPNSKHTLNAGIGTTRYLLSPGNMQPLGNGSLISRDKIRNEQGLESAAYISENFEVNQKFTLYLALRYSFYQNRGPGDVFLYAPDAPIQTKYIVDTVSYNSGKSIARYHGPEPRVSIRYMVSKASSIKVSYNRMRQYIQMLSTTASINPTDIWKLSDRYVKPQTGDQIAFGFYQYLKGNTIETSVETYYKNIETTVDYKNGAVILLNHHLETEIADARAKAYGVEFMIKKLTGKLNGWVSYTYSRSFLQTKGEAADEKVNNGDWYPSNFDKPHAVNFIGNYKFNRRINFSLNVIYSTGRPITLPIGKYTVDGTARVFYSDRNQFRIPDYFRSDISFNIEGNHKIRKLAHSSWTFSIYNVLGRANPYSIYFETENGRINGYKFSVFGRPIPTITYNFKF